MARTTLTVRSLPRGGEALTTEAADTVNGNQFTSESGNQLQLSFFAAAGCTVTILGALYVDGDSGSGIKVADRVLTIPAGTVFLWNCPPVSALEYNPYRQADGYVYINFSATCSVAIYQT